MKPLIWYGRAALVAALLQCPELALAGELVYRPVNPAFGGNPLNGTYLLNEAQAQNIYNNQSSSRTSAAQSTPLDQFVRNLQSQLLSRLSTQVAESIFGENAAENGEIVFGSQTVRFTRGVESISITIDDAATGQTTSVLVPILEVR